MVELANIPSYPEGGEPGTNQLLAGEPLLGGSSPSSTAPIESLFPAWKQAFLFVNNSWLAVHAVTSRMAAATGPRSRPVS